MAQPSGSKTKKGSKQASKSRVMRKEVKGAVKPAKKVAKPKVKVNAKKPHIKAGAKKGSKPTIQRAAKPVAGRVAAKGATAKPVVEKSVSKGSAKGGGAKPAVKNGLKKAVNGSGDPDFLSTGSVGPSRLVGGLDRNAQLPTSLVPRMDLPAAVPLTLQVQAVPGLAAQGKVYPANVLVLVTCAGWPVVDLKEDHFSIMEHFEIPGGGPTFSNNIVSFRNAGSGAYLLQIKPGGTAPWRAGQHLMQVIASSPDERHGQAAAKLIVR